MAFKFFTVPIQDSGRAEGELNGFLRSHKVLSVDRRWVEQGPSSFWSFCVDYLETSSGGTGDGRPAGQRGKVDYKEVLSTEDFAVFARLRELRKEIAQAEAVPVYTIFTNEQLAQMVQARVQDKAALEKIAGVGDARLDKYGARMLEVLAGAWPQQPEAEGDEQRRLSLPAASEQTEVIRRSAIAVESIGRCDRRARTRRRNGKPSPHFLPKFLTTATGRPCQDPLHA